MSLPGPLATPSGALAVAAAVVTAGVGLLALRNRSTPGATWLAAVLLVDAVVVAFAVGGHALPRTRQVALAVGGLGLLAAVPYVAFVVAYTGRGRHLTYWSLLGYGGPLIVAAALYGTTQYHGLMLAGRVGVHRAAGLTLLEFGGQTPLLGATLLYVALLVLGTVLLVLQTVVRHERLYLGQSAVLVVAAAAPLAAALPSVGLGRSPRGVGPLTVMVAAGLMLSAGLAVAFAAVQFRLFDFVPAVRQLGDRAAIDDLDEGVLIVDDGDNVVKLNDAAEAVLGAAGDVVGTPAERLFGRVGVEDVAATPTTFEADNRTHEVTTSPVTDERDRPIGRTFVIRDVTRRERRKQRLQVLNRVLRHNVRNDMSVVRMNSEVVAEEGGERLAPLGEKMVDIADELVEAGEKVRRTEQLLSAEELSTHTVSLADLLSSVVDDAVVDADRTAVDATVEVEAGADAVEVNRELLELALENVVENAIEHNDATVPTVAVTADRTVDGVRITVADDGPGIHEQELGALEAGRETDLQHASSLGLWLVLWSVGRLGGDLDIEHLEPTGTAVSVRLPSAATVDDASPAADEGEAPPDGTPDAAADRAAAVEDAGSERVDPTAVSLVADGVAEDRPGEDGPSDDDGQADEDVPDGATAGDPAPSGTPGTAGAADGKSRTGAPVDGESATGAPADGASATGAPADEPSRTGGESTTGASGGGSATGGRSRTDSGPPRPPVSARQARDAEEGGADADAETDEDSGPDDDQTTGSVGTAADGAAGSNLTPAQRAARVASDDAAAGDDGASDAGAGDGGANDAGTGDGGAGDEASVGADGEPVAGTERTDAGEEAGADGG